MKKKKKKKKKFYQKVIDYLKEEYKFLLLCALIVFIGLYRLPYNIYTGGGILDINDRVTVVDGYSSKGSFNMAYVDELGATIPTYLLSYIFNWDVEPVSESLVDENDTTSDLWKRERIYLENSNDNAIINAYHLAGLDIKINKVEVVVLYISSEAKTDLEIGDVIISVDNHEVVDDQELIRYMDNYQVGDKVKVKVLRDGKEKECQAELIDVSGKAKIGIALNLKYDYKIDREIKLNFKRNEAGPSAGLMLTLEIYNQLVSEDLTKGYKIAGTGTIDIYGNIGTIGGIKYKIKGANNSDAKIFFVPEGNYEEALKEKNENNYKIELVKVSTVADAINYLKEMK